MMLLGCSGRLQFCWKLCMVVCMLVLNVCVLCLVCGFGLVRYFNVFSCWCILNIGLFFLLGFRLLLVSGLVRLVIVWCLKFGLIVSVLLCMCFSSVLLMWLLVGLIFCLVWKWCMVCLVEVLKLLLGLIVVLVLLWMFMCCRYCCVFSMCWLVLFWCRFIVLVGVWGVGIGIWKFGCCICWIRLVIWDFYLVVCVVMVFGQGLLLFSLLLLIEVCVCWQLVWLVLMLLDSCVLNRLLCIFIISILVVMFVWVVCFGCLISLWFIFSVLFSCLQLLMWVRWVKFWLKYFLLLKQCRFIVCFLFQFFLGVVKLCDLCCVVVSIQVIC